MLDLIRQLHIKEGPSSRRSQKASAVGSFKSGPGNPFLLSPSPACIPELTASIYTNFKHSQNRGKCNCSLFHKTLHCPPGAGYLSARISEEGQNRA
jgi:hypothetical protein